MGNVNCAVALKLHKAFYGIWAASKSTWELGQYPARRETVLSVMLIKSIFFFSSSFLPPCNTFLSGSDK